MKRLGRTAALISLAAFAAFALASAPGRADQLTLSSGDFVTVTGTGTVGIINNQPISNTTSSYSNGSGVLNTYAVITNGTAAFTLGPGGSLSGADIQDPGNGGAGDGLVANGTGAITISGGMITGGMNSDAVDDRGSGPFTISGGTINGGENALAVRAAAGVINITGGIINTGTSSGTFTASGLEAIFGGSIDLFSQNDTPFLINGVPMNNTHVNGGGTVSGTLLNGDTLNTTFDGGLSLNIGAAPAPEPSPFAALSLGALSLCALALKARKRRVGTTGRST